MKRWDNRASRKWIGLNEIGSIDNSTRFSQQMDRSILILMQCYLLRSDKCILGKPSLYITFIFGVYILDKMSTQTVLQNVICVPVFQNETYVYFVIQI